MSNIVIGSGLAGMSIALLLAQQNQEVTIIEATHAPAPLMRGFKRSSLFFDTGFHCAGGLAPNGALYRWLNALGVWKYIGDNSIQFKSEEFRFSPEEKYYFPAQESTLLSAISEQFQDSESFEKLLSMMKEIVGNSPYTNPSQNKALQLMIKDDESLPDVLATLSLSPTLKQMLMARCLLIGLQPEETSFEHYALLSAPYFESCASLEGGGKKISDAFLHALEDAGITVQCNSKLESLLVKDGELNGIKLADGKELSCTRCFFTGHPQQLKSIVPPKIFRPAFFHRIEDMVETPYTFMLFAETKSEILRNKVIYLLSKKNMNIVNNIEHGEPRIYVSGGDPVNKRYPVTAIVLIDQDKFKKGDESYSSWKQEYANTLAKYIEKNIPELAPLKILDAATPSTLRHWVYGTTGSFCGIAHVNNSFPLLHITKLDGFYLAGQNILLPGVLGAIVSAAICTGFALGHKKILKGFKL